MLVARRTRREQTLGAEPPRFHHLSTAGRRSATGGERKLVALSRGFPHHFRFRQRKARRGNHLESSRPIRELAARRASTRTSAATRAIHQRHLISSSRWRLAPFPRIIKSQQGGCCIRTTRRKNKLLFAGGSGGRANMQGTSCRARSGCASAQRKPPSLALGRRVHRAQSGALCSRAQLHTSTWC